MIDISAIPRDVSERMKIERHTAALLAASRPPTDAQIAILVTRDAVPVAMEYLRPFAAGLGKLLGRTVQGLLIYRVAFHFGIKDIGCIEQLRQMKTPQARLARAGLGDLPWRSASHDERRAILSRRLIMARALV